MCCFRKEQYRISDDIVRSTAIAKNMIIGKVYNSKWVLERATRDHPLQVDVDSIKKVTTNLDVALEKLLQSDSMDSIRGIEGEYSKPVFFRI